MLTFINNKNIIDESLGINLIKGESNLEFELR
jgi:hypothetical protein